MNCQNCHKKNIKKAKYCRYCGNEFTKEEIEIASNKGVVGFLKKIKKVKDWLTFNDSVIAKIIYTIIVLGIGVYFLINQGINLKLLNSNDYILKYNKENNLYHVIVKNENLDELPLNIYIPNRISQLDLKQYNLNGEIIDEEPIDKKHNIKVKILNGNDGYYEIINHNDSKEKLIISVYYED